MTTEHEVAWSTTVSVSATRSIGFLYVFGGLGCLLGAIWPLDPSANTSLTGAIGVSVTLVGALLFIPGLHVARWVIHTLICAAFVVIGIVVGESVTLAGAILTAFALPFTGLYASYFLTLRAARSQVGFGVLIFTLAWFTREGESPVSAWLVICTGLVVTAEILARLMIQLHRTAVADELTGLLNRAGLRPSLEREIARASRTGRPLAVTVIDVDGLKQVNDILGHASGDRLLTDLAEAWTGVLRRNDLLARVGGDEFVIVMPETSVDEARDVVERLREVRGPARGTRWSAGVALLREGESSDDLLDRADRRMYAAKRAGRDVQSGV
jgi:diguanylate cyclase (GGDEF)-like protein